MREFISLDCHKHYTLAERDPVQGGRPVQTRIVHEQGAIRQYLKDIEPQTTVALEATGNWYWIVEEIELAGGIPALAHPRKAKLMMGMINKTDKLDVHGLNRLQRNGTLPTVWIPPRELRDVRELTRMRMLFSRHRTALKNRLHAMAAKYALSIEDCSDAFGTRARQQWQRLQQQFPQQTAWCCQMLLEQLDSTQKHLDEQEQRVKELVQQTPAMKRLGSLPGVGPILAAVIGLEIGDVGRFPTAQDLASYCGTTPRVSSSGGKTRYGKVRNDVNRYLKWAFAEAANVVVMHQRHWPERHVVQLYRRVKSRKGHAKAAMAVARHLAEASWHMLVKQQEYRDPAAEPARRAKPSATGQKTGVSAVSSCGLERVE